MNQDATIAFPHIFKDGRARKVWIAYGPPSYETDGPFDDDADAQAALEIHHKANTETDR